MPACTMARAQSTQGKKEAASVAPLVESPRFAAEDDVALGMLDPQPGLVALMALLDVAHTFREGVAGRKRRAAIGGQQRRAHLAHAIGAFGCGAVRKLQQGIDIDAISQVSSPR
jgi:hypothetical protein